MPLITSPGFPERAPNHGPATRRRDGRCVEQRRACRPRCNCTGRTRATGSTGGRPRGADPSLVDVRRIGTVDVRRGASRPPRAVPPDVRDAAWVRGERPTRSARPQAAARPVIYAGDRAVAEDRARRPDVLDCAPRSSTTDPARVIGAKAVRFERWKFDPIGADTTNANESIGRQPLVDDGTDRRGRTVSRPNALAHDAQQARLPTSRSRTSQSPRSRAWSQAAAT